MPDLACWSCGRRVYTVAPIESLFSEERRCPRCGALLNHERRDSGRRKTSRRTNPLNDPGPPPDELERRDTDRRRTPRRGT